LQLVSHGGPASESSTQLFYQTLIDGLKDNARILHRKRDAGAGLDAKFGANIRGDDELAFGTDGKHFRTHAYIIT
jgi:hypothetical protein